MDYNREETLKLSNQLCFPLYAAARSVINLYTPYLKPLGLTYTQYIVFLVLWEKKSVTVSELCETLMLDNGTLTPLLKKLQTEGYIERRRSEKDDRVVVISLTEEGADLKARAAEIPFGVGVCIGLEPEKAQMLYELLYELLNKQNAKEV
ncbi:MAG: MarR family transcriptional regulator [Clostridia bacterium]|nr:MarR family transcriptional regulator [Clostridia bacterium]